VSESQIKVAFFPDTYLEVDGVANTARQFEAYVRRHDLPMVLVYGGYEDKIKNDGNVTLIERKRGPIAFGVDKKHDFDLLFLRHYEKIAKLLRATKPDVIHITGPSDVGILGVLVAHYLRIPLIASWHTNLHQYAEQRALALLRFLPEGMRRGMGPRIRAWSFQALARYYRIPRVLLAPNRELEELLEQHTTKRCFPMGRGVDTSLFDPRRRTRTNESFTIGYVGRLTVEKSVEVLAQLEKALLAAGLSDFRFLIVGQGSSEPWLRQNMQTAEFAGVLHGEKLAAAYANMDVFVFPSLTDTFGNVVLEALASGVPSVVSNCGGPQFIVRQGDTGFVAKSLAEFVESIRRLHADRQLLGRMRSAARQQALACSWDSIFDGVYKAYEEALSMSATRARVPLSSRQVSII